MIFLRRLWRSLFRGGLYFPTGQLLDGKVGHTWRPHEWVARDLALMGYATVPRRFEIAAETAEWGERGAEWGGSNLWWDESSSNTESKTGWLQYQEWKRVRGYGVDYVPWFQPRLGRFVNNGVLERR